MTKTIAQLWNGNLNPIRSLRANNSEIKQLEDLIQRNHERLEESLNEKGKEIFERYKDCVDEYMIVFSEQAFCDGFCLGVKIISEALNGSEQADSMVVGQI